MVGVSPFKGRLMDEILDAEYKVVEQSNRAATRTHIVGRAKLNLQTLVVINDSIC
jgi:hypothetical protein